MSFAKHTYRGMAVRSLARRERITSEEARQRASAFGRAAIDNIKRNRRHVDNVALAISWAMVSIEVTR
jgi:hypothetical protein